MLHTLKFWLVLTYFMGAIAFLQLWAVNRHAIERTCKAQDVQRIVLVHVLDEFRADSLSRVHTKAESDHVQLVFQRAVKSLNIIGCKTK